MLFIFQTGSKVDGKLVTSIGGGAFLNCSSVTSVKISDSVTTIGGHAFKHCRSLVSVAIGNSVTIIGKEAFLNCSKLTRIIFKGDAPKEYFFEGLFNDTKILISKEAKGFNKTFAGLPVYFIEDYLELNGSSIAGGQFSISFETKSDSTYTIEASHDLMKWGGIGEVQGTGSSVKFIERRKAMFPQQYYRVKLVE